MTGGRARRGFSLMELLVASMLAVLFAGVVSSALASSTSLARDSLVKGTLEQRARELTDTMAFFLRGAGAPGRCEDPDAPQGWPLADCLSVAERDSAFDAASSTSVTFYSYSTQLESSASAAALTVPDRVVLTQANGRLTIVRYPPLANATYTSPAWASTPVTVRDLVVNAPTDGVLFRYFDSSGQRLGSDTSAVPAADLRRIALVQMSPRVSQQVGGETRTAGLDLSVAISKAGVMP